MPVIYKDATVQEVENALKDSKKAFDKYGKLSLRDREVFLDAIAQELESAKELLIDIAHKETNLAKPRLEGELKRTIFQLRTYGAACKEGTWLDIRIDTAENQTEPPANDIRKMLVPLGPVVVFGASNFPFAYSTAGGDMACALAAGCTVIIKAHPAHAGTSEMVSLAVRKVAKQCKLPDNIFIHLHGGAIEIGKALVLHPLTAAVGFTGSFDGGKALFDLANTRPVPIPVFAEMGSVNPVFILPGILKEQSDKIANMYAASITLSAGQFCTNPGILVAIDDNGLANFCKHLFKEIAEIKPELMLHPGIAKSFKSKRSEALAQKGVQLAAQTKFKPGENESIPTVARVDAALFLNNPLLHKEVFGPYSLLVTCKDSEEMLAVAKSLEGQLTTTIMATNEELNSYAILVETLKKICGRIILNGVPTGVRVSLSMQHGGPFPATTDNRFTAVGADGIKRFSRPLCYQGWPNDFLPLELQNENPLNLWRTVNNVLTKQPISLQ